MFPFTITYTRRLTRKLSGNEITEALNQIKKVFEEKTAEGVEINDNQLTFNVSFFGLRWNWNIMVSIEKGKISLTSDNDAAILTYKIFMYRLFIVTAMMSTFAGILSGTIGIAIFAFVWLCGANWITVTLRHKGLIGDIAEKISKGLE